MRAKSPWSATGVSCATVIARFLPARSWSPPAAAPDRHRPPGMQRPTIVPAVRTGSPTPSASSTTHQRTKTSSAPTNRPATATSVECGEPHAKRGRARRSSRARKLTGADTICRIARMTLACATTASTCENDTARSPCDRNTNAMTAASTSVSTGPPASAVTTPYSGPLPLSACNSAYLASSTGPARRPGQSAPTDRPAPPARPPSGTGAPGSPR